VRDKGDWIARKTRDAAGATQRDLGNRLRGMRARARARAHDDAADDATVRGRVRAELGRASSHPRAIETSVADGIVRLTGDALQSEAGTIETAVTGVRGVRGVRNELRTHERADAIPALQGQSTPAGSWPAWLRSGWSPTARLACGIATGGAGLALASLARNRSGRHRTEADHAAIEVFAVDVIPTDVLCD
jgi:hypothetical protein